VTDERLGWLFALTVRDLCLAGAAIQEGKANQGARNKGDDQAYQLVQLTQDGSYSVNLFSQEMAS